MTFIFRNLSAKTLIFKNRTGKIILKLKTVLKPTQVN